MLFPNYCFISLKRGKMKIYLDCIPCFFRQGLEAARMATDDEAKQRRVLEEVAKELPRIPLNSTPPEMGRKIHQIIRQVVGCSDPYRQIKEKYNRLALQLYPNLKKRVEKAKDPLLMAIRLAIAGNIIDCGMKTSFDLEKEIEVILQQDFAVLHYSEFRRRLKETKEILYLADNSSEVIFDRILIEELNKKMIYVVRESPVINDATMEDAHYAGIDKLATVITSGSDAPATLLDLASKQFLDHFDRATFIISKGQGNYESLSQMDKPIFFLLKAKCPVIAKDIGCQVGDIILQGPQSSP